MHEETWGGTSHAALPCSVIGVQQNLGGGVVSVGVCGSAREGEGFCRQKDRGKTAVITYITVIATACSLEAQPSDNEFHLTKTLPHKEQGRKLVHNIALSLLQISLHFSVKKHHVSESGAKNTRNPANRQKPIKQSA